MLPSAVQDIGWIFKSDFSRCILQFVWERITGPIKLFCCHKEASHVTLICVSLKFLSLFSQPIVLQITEAPLTNLSGLCDACLCAGVG